MELRIKGGVWLLDTLIRNTTGFTGKATGIGRGQSDLVVYLSFYLIRCCRSIEVNRLSSGQSDQGLSDFS